VNDITLPATFDGPALSAMLERIHTTLESARDRLCELDGAIGDADHGITMEAGFRAVRDAQRELAPDAVPSTRLAAAARAFLNATGASAGPLYATAFLRASAALKGRDTLDAAATAALIDAMREGIFTRGKAEPGDKTMLDAWLPAAVAALSAASTDDASPASVLDAASSAAADGARATAALQARLGRAARLGERSIGHVDPGAVSAALLLAAMTGRAADVDTVLHGALDEMPPS